MTSNINVDFKLDDEEIKKAINELGKQISIKVGILGSNGSKQAKNDDNELGKITMATLGAIHEFGSVKANIPARSFIRMPLETKYKEELSRNKGFKQALKELDIAKLNNEAGLTATVVINDAFASGGFGEWTPLKPETIRKKGSDGILIDTGDLRRSISYEVANDK